MQGVARAVVVVGGDFVAVRRESVARGFDDK